VEPLYLLAETSELPELKRVIVASGDRIAMRETLEEALVALIQAGPTVDQIVEEPPVSEGLNVNEVPAESEISDDASPTPTPGSAETPIINESIQDLVDAAGAHFEAAEQAQRDGDWATYGRELEALGEVLRQLAALSGGE
jgi:uncharacterized membrane protein (UPF0182 family)